ncbi:RNA-binding protein, putative [Plasmodium ovale curtisi]|uniref:RNA-binding protein, putative n=1 Tax=Plasmodium ovale curtisi TaxID=864141 RepID=A0A1A8W889_PLAOA|nr:RNA-binding protein, putative [Plasmodium ovale curtisi]
MGLFDKIRTIEKLNEAELKNIGNSDSSWHDQYKDSSYIYIGNLDTRLTEGDIVIVFSQFGEPIDVNLVRDKETGIYREFHSLLNKDAYYDSYCVNTTYRCYLLFPHKKGCEICKSKGYCFLSYEDQRSTILAVDNFNGFKLLEKPLVVDHILNYRLPKDYINRYDPNEYKPTGAEGKGIGVNNVIESEIKLTKAFEKVKNNQNQDKRKKLLDEEELWAMNFEKAIKEKTRNEKIGKGDKDSPPDDGTKNKTRDEHKEEYFKRNNYRSKRKYDTERSKRKKHTSYHKRRSSEEKQKRSKHSRSYSTSGSRAIRKGEEDDKRNDNWFLFMIPPKLFLEAAKKEENLLGASITLMKK